MSWKDFGWATTDVFISKFYINNWGQRQATPQTKGLSKLFQLTILRYHKPEEIMKNTVLWDMMPCSFCKNRCFVGTYRLLHLGENNPRARNVTADAVPSLLILFALMMEAIYFSEASVLTRETQRHISEDSILHCHRREILNSYQVLTGWALWERCNVSCEVRTGVLYLRRPHSS
jgi:hypothetical protein